jgi:DNA-binding beta-propeller fold protein YncE
MVIVASEASDRVSRVRYGPRGIRIEQEVAVGANPVHVNGPHGIASSPDRRFYYVTTGHGTPFGSLWKYAAASDSLVARVPLGLFPATVAVTPDGTLAFAVNFNLHGPHEPSSVSIVSTEQMIEIARVRTCVMPHGSRFNPQGTKHYSACMMDDRLVEIDVQSLAVSRTLDLSPHTESRCSPTWVQPSSGGRRVFVACNASNEIVEVDVDGWAVERRFPAGEGVYNLATTSDGRRLVATNKRDQSVSIVDLESGRELARIPSSHRIVHGVVVSPDDRYAFVTAEGVGSESGAVDVLDLSTLTVVATVDVGRMTGGIEFWRLEATKLE